MAPKTPAVAIFVKPVKQAMLVPTEMSDMGPSIGVIKTHIDITSDFRYETINGLKISSGNTGDYCRERP